MTNLSPLQIERLKYQPKLPSSLASGISHLVSKEGSATESEHNTDILEMQLPMHTFTFLKKDKNNIDTTITCISADQYLKKNTDSLKNAVDNDLFCTAPELSKLFDVMSM